MNSDCLYEILLKTDACNVRSVANSLSNRWGLGDTTELIERRLSPYRIFSEITDDVESLLSVMMVTGTMLSGSRAANFLYPGCSSSDSDFDFYIGSSLVSESLANFMKFIESIDGRWKDIDTDSDSEKGETTYPHSICIHHGSIQRGERVYTIQVISIGLQNCINALTRYHSSAPQCFVNYMGAFSLYHTLSEKRLMVEWHTYDKDPSNTRKDAILKYKNRGFTSVPYSKYKDEVSKAGYVTNQDGSRIRHIGDADTHMVLFPIKHSIIRDKRERILHIQMMKLFQWNEHIVMVLDRIIDERTSAYKEGTVLTEHTRY